MYACSYGAAFGAIQHLPRIVPGLTEVATLARPAQEKIISAVQGSQETGGLVGRIALAILAIYIVKRRTLLRVFQLPGLFIVPFVFFYRRSTICRCSSWRLRRDFDGRPVQFLGKLPAPRLSNPSARNGESFAANIGGRMLGTSAALLTTQLEGTCLAYAAASVACLPADSSPASGCPSPNRTNYPTSPGL
jgi:hypothetical protein